MRITDSQREKLSTGQERLETLLRLTQQIFDQNAEDSSVESTRDSTHEFGKPNTSNEDLNAIGHLSELVLETAKHLKALRKRRDEILWTKDKLKPL